MNDRCFVFQTTPYDIETLFPQLSHALEARTELLSREKYPQLWNVTDTLNASNDSTSSNPKLSLLKSILFLLVGLFLLIPALTKPQEMLVPLLFGVIGVIAGIRGLMGNRKPNLKRMKQRFDIAARQLLDGKDTLSQKDIVTITFREDGMQIPADDNQAELVAYNAFESVVEEPDLYLLIFDTRISVLQKCDLPSTDIEAFRALLTEKIPHFLCCCDS